MKEAQRIEGIQKSFAHLPPGALQPILDQVNEGSPGASVGPTAFTVEALIHAPVS